MISDLSGYKNLWPIGINTEIVCNRLEELVGKLRSGKIVVQSVSEGIDVGLEYYSESTLTIRFVEEKSEA